METAISLNNQRSITLERTAYEQQLEQQQKKQVLPR
jgi:hypothetical protein